MNHKPFSKAAVLKTVAFCLFLSICIHTINRLVTPKFLLENSSWPSTSTFTQFYQVKEHTVDALFLGSSSISSACNPQYIYDNHSIVSYNLASPEQTLITSYYWLKEALRFQSPSVVFLDTQMLFTYYADEPLNFKEPGLRKDFDRMKWSKVKVDAIHDIFALDSSQSKLSYYFPFVRYHNRFKELTKPDFSYTISKLYGFAPLYGDLHEEGEADFIPLSDTFSETGNIPPSSDGSDAGDSSNETILPLMKEYMDKIVALCKEKNIHLVLITTVSPSQTQNRHDLTARYAITNRLPYLDFNTSILYQETQMEYFKDCYDTRHMTISGALKISDYLANYGLSEGFVTPGISEDFQNTKQYYEDFMVDYCK